MIHKKKIGAHIALLELDNPPANTLSRHMKQQFLQLVGEMEKDDDLRALIITGKGDKFCSGDDLKEAVQGMKTKDGIIKNLRHFGEAIDRFEALPFPLIAAINGWCIGGGLELALCCDIRIACSSARFITAGVNVGLPASAYRLPRLIGIGRAKRMLLTGMAIDAETALEYGLITDIYEDEALLHQAINLAEVVASKAPLATAAAKRIANRSLEAGPEEGLLIQQRELESLAQSADHREALMAFHERRKPQFSGK